MVSKFCSIGTLVRPMLTVQNLVPPQRLTPGIQAPRSPQPAQWAPKRHIFGLVPENQYENNVIPKKFHVGYALSHHWEIIPLFFCVIFDIFFVLCGSVYVGLKHKVDTQWTGHNWNCISRTMDLRNPTIHKNLVLYQRYEPWPEMQAVLDKMTEAAHRFQTRLDSCGRP